MSALVSKSYSDPYFNIENAASPQRSRPDSIERAIRRLSRRSLREDIDSLVQIKENIWLTETNELKKKSSTISLPNISEKEENNTQTIQSKKKKRFSLFFNNNKVEVEPIKKIEEKKVLKQSFFASLRKLFGSKGKVGSDNSRAKAKNLFDDDDGILDESDISLGISLNDGGMPFGLANSTLRTTYMHSLQKLQYRDQRPLAQLMLIHTVVNRLQDHVKNNNEALLPATWLPPNKAPYTRRRSLKSDKELNKKLTSRSESDLTTSNRPVFNVRRASRSQDFLLDLPSNLESLNLRSYEY